MCTVPMYYCLINDTILTTTLKTNNCTLKQTRNNLHKKSIFYKCRHYLETAETVLIILTVNGSREILSST